jgi:hypothetical protein
MVGKADFFSLGNLACRKLGFVKNLRKEALDEIHKLVSDASSGIHFWLRPHDY